MFNTCSRAETRQAWKARRDPASVDQEFLKMMAVLQPDSHGDGLGSGSSGSSGSRSALSGGGVAYEPLRMLTTVAVVAGAGFIAGQHCNNLQFGHPDCENSACWQQRHQHLSGFCQGFLHLWCVASSSPCDSHCMLLPAGLLGIAGAMLFNPFLLVSIAQAYSLHHVLIASRLTLS